MTPTPIASPMAFNMPQGIAASSQDLVTDAGHPMLVLTVSGSKVVAINIPVLAIPDRRVIYGVPACTTFITPGAYCTGAPFCANCQACLQHCIDEHKAAGRL